MTVRISLIAAVIVTAILSCDTDRNIAPVYQQYFTKYYGEDGLQTAVDLAVNDDGTMVMIGSSQSQGADPTPHGFIVKTDNQGIVLWERRMGDDNEVPVDVEFDNSDNIIVVSNYQSKSVRLTRISQSGAGIDSTLIENAAGIVGTSVTQISNGNFLVAGYAGPNLVDDGADIPKNEDVEDLLVYEVSADFATNKVQLDQGGEHVGKIVKVFQSEVNGPTRYYSFGDSDRPFSGTTYRQAFEVTQLNEFFDASQWTSAGPLGEVQISSEAIAMPVAGQDGYLMVGSSGPAGQDLFKQIFLTQYTDARPDITIRFQRIIPTPRSAEGVSVAYGERESMFVLADELQDNNNHDIYLVKLESDGAKVGEMRFGSVEGEDRAAAVRVLPDQRVAVFGTIELATQKKMMLTLVSPMGTFSE